MAVEAILGTPRSLDSSPRISFSADFLDEANFISINPHSHFEKRENSDLERKERDKARAAAEFEFLSSNVNSSTHTMMSADELFFDGKLLPFRQMQQSDQKLNKISLKVTKGENQEEKAVTREEPSRVNWFVDDDPSPRPPKCTVLWKELLRLKKQRASSLSPSSSSSSTSSSSSSLADVASKEEGKHGSGNKDKHVKKIKKGLERTRSATIRIRPMINVPICTQMKSTGLPPLFPLKKGRLEMR